MFRGESQPEKGRKAPVKFVEKNQKEGRQKTHMARHVRLGRMGQEELSSSAFRFSRRVRTPQ